MLDVIIVGGGQAGLAAAYYLKQHGVKFLILDSSHNIGDSWRNRYDSLQLFTPRMYDSLPGMDLKGEPHGLPDKNEVANYLEDYSNHFQLPIKNNTRVLSLKKMDGYFELLTTEGTYTSKKVIVATGPFQEAFIPPINEKVGDKVKQLHSSEYRNANQLQKGTVLVVGAGNSGAQIACELAETFDVHLSASNKINYKPLYIMGRSIFWYFNTFGIITAKRSSILGKWLYKQPEMVYGNTLKPLIDAGKIKLHSRTIRIQDQDAFFAEDNSAIHIDNIIWSTGFRRNDQWIEIEEAFRNGALEHNEGISVVKGLYFLGLPWQTTRGSALLGWVKNDANRIVDHLLQN